MTKPLINITRLRGVEKQLTRIADNLDLLLIYNGIKQPPKDQIDDEGEVVYQGEDESLKRALRDELGLPEEMER